MALADIIARLHADAEAEAAAIKTAGDERVAEALAAARAKADAILADATELAETVASRESATVVVNARLRARDEAVAARRALIEKALNQAADAIAELPDERYALVLAKRIAQTAGGGETVSFGRLDAGRADAVMRAVKESAPQLLLTQSGEPAPFDRGVLLTGDRKRVDLSLGSLVDERRDELELAVAGVLFGEGA